jgi:hypothetical protein
MDREVHATAGLEAGATVLPGIQRSGLVFHAPGERKGAYNQREEKKAVSGRQHVVVQCGQSG